MRGTFTAIVNLRHGHDAGGWSALRQAAGSALVAAGIAAMLLFGSVAGSFFWRGTRYAALADQARSEKEAMFHTVFPGQPIPVGIESRLESAARQMRQSGRAGQENVQPDALAAFHEILRHLPTDVRYSVSDLALDHASLTLQGEVRSHEDADAIALALRKSATLSIDDPQTQQVAAGTVQFSMNGAIHGLSPSPTRKVP